MSGTTTHRTRWADYFLNAIRAGQRSRPGFGSGQGRRIDTIRRLPVTLAGDYFISVT
jgi:hypothetical protein